MPEDKNITKVELPKVQKKFDLEDRTLVFSQELIDFSRKLPKDPVSTPMISQLVRSGTSIGANCCEATEAGSKKDFINKITIAKKEAKETRYWLKLLYHAYPDQKVLIDKLLREAQELNLILAAIVRNSKENISRIDS
jgi:four helix bundle protein